MTPLQFAQLQVTCDAKDWHKVDGIPEIPADGMSFTTLTIQTIDAQGNPITTEKDCHESFSELMQVQLRTRKK